MQQKALVNYIDKPNFIIRGIRIKVKITKIYLYLFKAFIEKHSYEAITENLVKLSECKYILDIKILF